MFILTKSLDENIKLFKNLFLNDHTFIVREFQSQTNPGSRFCILYIEGMADSIYISKNIIMPLMQMNKNVTLDDMDIIANQFIMSTEVDKTNNTMEMIDSIISGDSILLAEGIEEVLIVGSKGYKTRGIEEPVIEKAIRGPREGFNESLLTNLSMIRRKLETKDLKFQFKRLGEKSNTRACICYIEGTYDERVLDEVKRRIDSIELDGLFDTRYIHELIADRGMSIFEMSGQTEKPDVLAAKLLEGRIGILLDGTPSVMTVPYLFIENFQTGEDYYTNFYFATIRRLIRMLGFIITTSFPSIYLALVTYHKEVLPPTLILSILSSRQGVPFPSVIELVGLFLAFEILIEASSRTPSHIGQTLGIVGALILGSAAVEARIVSSAMIIVVGFSSVSSLMIPGMKSQSVILRLIFIFSSFILGLYGHVLSMTALLIHLFSLKSFGVLYMSTINSVYPKDLKDTYFRWPRWFIERTGSGGSK